MTDPSRLVTDPDDVLDERKAAILRAIVAEYVTSGEPIGSKRVVEVAQLDVSAATVRNEMQALEELGYISQPHTSAGRVPTDKGYRYFVDELRNRHRLVDDGRQSEAVAQLMGTATDVEDVLRQTTQVLSHLTHLVSLVVAPAVDTARLKLIELVNLSPQVVLVLLVTDTGRVRKQLIELLTPLTEADVDRVRSAVADSVNGRRVGEIEALVDRMADEAPPELRELLRELALAVARLEEAGPDRVYVGGRAALAGPGGLERRDLSRILELLEERVTLARILAESAVTDEPLIRIGEEHDLVDLQGTALVAQRYQLATTGSLGVLGPTRMDYANVLSSVQVVAEQLQRTLRRLSSGD